MAQMMTVKLRRPVKSAGLVRQGAAQAVDASPVVDPRTHELELQLGQVQAQQRQMVEVCRVLEDLTGKLTRFHQDLLAGHRQQIAKLSVEIARKVLAQKISERDYRVEAVIQEALANAPCQQDVVVHLNPADLADLQAVIQAGADSPLAAIQFVSDPTMGKAECLLVTPKGVVKSFVESHLQKIQEALEKAV